MLHCEFDRANPAEPADYTLLAKEGETAASGGAAAWLIGHVRGFDVWVSP